MLKKYIKRIFKQPVMQQGGKFLIRKTALVFQINLLNFAYREIGVLNYENKIISGEKYLIEKILKKIINKNSNKIVLFDVGANVGDTCILLIKSFPNSNIYAFEPNNFAYNRLLKNVNGMDIKCFNIGFGERSEIDMIYIPDSDMKSESASFHKSLFRDFYNDSNIESFECEIMDIDTFCTEHSIDFIDFIKIDTEGYEYLVLEGASRMLKENKIGTIQFEFGECHVFSRTFLRDFYKKLYNYKLYRLNTNNLVNLGKYNVSNEIYRFQNIIAIHNDINNNI